MSNDVFSSVFLPAFIYYAWLYLSRLLWRKWPLFKAVTQPFRKGLIRNLDGFFFVESFSIFPLLNAKYDYDDGVVKSLLHNKYWVTNAFS